MRATLKAWKKRPNSSRPSWPKCRPTAAARRRTINGIKAIVQQVTVDKPAALRELADRFKDRIGSGVVVLGCETGGKALLIVVVTKDLGGRFPRRQHDQNHCPRGGRRRRRPARHGPGRREPSPRTWPKALEKARELIAQG
jgi:alanyl-tRNA synthetase